MRKRILLGFLAAGLPLGAAQASPVLDQSYTGAVTSTFTISSTPGSGPGNYYLGQSFTAGKTGLLTQVGLAISDLGTSTPLFLQFRSASGGLPTSTVLGSGALALAVGAPPDILTPPSGFYSSANLFNVDVSGLGVYLNAGDQLAFLVSFTGGGQTVGIAGNSSATYTGGLGFYAGIGPAYAPVSTNSDFYFNTFVDTAIQRPTRVPETPTLLLFGAALLGLAMNRRRPFNKAG